jgi:antimicrobial peptide system SdpB family protein
MLTALGRWAAPRLAHSPWASGLGLARTLLALSTLGTLLATAPAVLLSPLSDGTVPPVCDGLFRAGVWCVVPAGHGEAARWLSVAVLLLVASGWRPQLTGIPHWYVVWSLLGNVTIRDGGDQIVAVLALLLVPVTLTDRRRWHWQPPTGDGRGRAGIVAYTALLLVQVQVSVLYLHASVAKLGVTEWANGTAMYYWTHNPMFTAPGWVQPVLDLIVAGPVGVALLTWGSVALEFGLAVAILVRPPVKRWLLVAGLAFHALIALTMGLASFGLAMAGALLLYLLPIGHQVRFPAVRPLWTYRGQAARREASAAMAGMVSIMRTRSAVAWARSWAVAPRWPHAARTVRWSRAQRVGVSAGRPAGDADAGAGDRDRHPGRDA